MDDLNNLEKNSTVDNLTHTAESGFVDIKPLQQISRPYKDIGLNILLFLGVLGFIYILYKLKNNFTAKKSPKKEILPINLFNKRLSELNTNKSDFRAYCEALSFALKSLLSTVFNYNFNSLTPYYLKLELLKITPRLLSYSTEQAEEYSNTVSNLVKKLEGGEYGDSLTIQQLAGLKEALFEETKNIGLNTISQIEKVNLQKKQNSKKNMRK